MLDVGWIAMAHFVLATCKIVARTRGRFPHGLLLHSVPLAGPLPSRSLTFAFHFRSAGLPQRRDSICICFNVAVAVAVAVAVSMYTSGA